MSFPNLFRNAADQSRDFDLLGEDEPELFVAGEDGELVPWTSDEPVVLETTNPSIADEITEIRPRLHLLTGEPTVPLPPERVAGPNDQQADELPFDMKALRELPTQAELDAYAEQEAWIAMIKADPMLAVIYAADIAEWDRQYWTDEQRVQEADAEHSMQMYLDALARQATKEKLLAVGFVLGAVLGAAVLTLT